ncbi:MAG: outer membrane beta-barrel protein [Paracoccaceae bacterium]
MRTLIAASAFALTATSSFAGDWTAGYAGVGLGYADVGLSAGLSGGNGGAGGIHGGYDYDFGDWVIGGELEYDWMSIGVASGAADLDNVGRLKFKVGYDLEDWLVYGVVGAARAYTSSNAIGNDNGWLAGVGAAYQVGPQWAISGELLYHEFSDFNNTGVDVDATTFNVRASYRF